MTWHDPGTSKNNHPPHLDKLIADFIKRMRAHLKIQRTVQKSPVSPQGHHLNAGVFSIAGIVVFLWFLSGFYIVNPAEEAVILRLGKYSETVPPGLHWFARFIENKYLVDVNKVYSFSLQGDFLTKSSEQNETLSLSSDQSKNLVNVELNVQYRIVDARSYLFNMVNVDDTIQEVASGALSDVIGKMKLDDVLTTGREFVSTGVLERARQVLSSYRSGVEIAAVTLRKVQAPDQVRAAFNDVNRADQDRATTIQQAQAYASKVVPLAQGLAARLIADAQGYQQQVVLRAKADVAKYQAIWQVYTLSPEITRQRLYLETMQSILQNSNKILVDGNTGNNLIYLPLDKIYRELQNDTH